MNDCSAEFDPHSFHSCSETDFHARVDLKLNARVDLKLLNSHWIMKGRSRAPGQSVCLKGMLRIITYARFDICSYHRLNSRVDVNCWQTDRWKSELLCRQIIIFFKDLLKAFRPHLFKSLTMWSIKKMKTDSHLFVLKRACIKAFYPPVIMFPNVINKEH